MFMARTHARYCLLDAAGLYFSHVKYPRFVPAAQRSYYSGTLMEFCAADRDEIFAQMARKNISTRPELSGTHGSRRPNSDSASWRDTPARSSSSSPFRAWPAESMRPLPSGPSSYVLESKVGENVSSQDEDQVVDYALELQNSMKAPRCVHRARTDLHAGPKRSARIPGARPSSRLFDVSLTNAEGLAETIERIVRLVEEPRVRIDQWEGSGYKPTPTIIEATLALYRGHSVTEISRSDAGATNLSKTARTVASIVARRRPARRRPSAS